MFTTMGMDAFLDQAARELAATGETVRKRSVGTANELTAQEEQIVRLVRAGLSNSEVAARLFISPRTVEWHLGRFSQSCRSPHAGNCGADAMPRNRQQKQDSHSFRRDDHAPTAAAWSATSGSRFTKAAATLVAYSSASPQA
jgi:hypothetical protein